MNLISPIHSQQEQLSRSQDPNNMTTQNQDQLSRSQDPNSMTHKTNPSKTQQDPNRMTDLTDLKKSAAARSIPVHQNPKPPSLSSLPSPTTVHQHRDGGAQTRRPKGRQLRRKRRCGCVAREHLGFLFQNLLDEIVVQCFSYPIGFNIMMPFVLVFFFFFALFDLLYGLGGAHGMGDSATSLVNRSHWGCR